MNSYEPFQPKDEEIVSAVFNLLVRCSRITLLKAAGLDFRQVGRDWALNQLLHNYTEECFLHLFATWAFTLGQC